MAEFIIVDNDVLSNLSHEAVNFNPTAMNALLIPGTTVVITSTVYGEATGFAGTNEYSAFRKSWLDENIAAGNIIFEETPAFPTGVPDAGELSMLEVGAIRYNGNSVTYVSNDNIFTDMGAAGFNAVNLIPGQTHNTGQGLLFKSLVEGGISTLEYQVSSYNLRDRSAEGPILDFGGTAVGSNGVIFTLTPVGLSIRQPDGTIVNPSPNERFLIDSSGNVEITGMFLPNVNGGQFIPLNDYCFLGDTSISMWPLDQAIQPRADGTYDEELVLSKVWKKPISEIKVGDLVVSYNDKGKIAPGPVSRAMQNNVTHILDFWDTGVTPGHAYLCGAGKFKGQHVPLMDILRTDGAIVRDDGTLLRAATNYEVDSLGDRMINATASVKKSDGTWSEQKRGQVRFGTRIILPDGRHMSFMEMAQSKGWGISDDGFMTAKVKTENGVDEQKFFFPYAHGEELPKPEDYILSRSEVSLQDIYAAGEWEQIGTRMPAPANMVGLNTNHTSTMLQPSKPEPNIPPAFANRPDVPRRALNRKQRKAMEAKQRKVAKVRKRVLVN